MSNKPSVQEFLAKRNEGRASPELVNASADQPNEPAAANDCGSASDDANACKEEAESGSQIQTEVPGELLTTQEKPLTMKEMLTQKKAKRLGLSMAEYAIQCEPKVSLSSAESLRKYLREEKEREERKRLRALAAAAQAAPEQPDNEEEKLASNPVGDDVPEESQGSDIEPSTIETSALHPIADHDESAAVQPCDEGSETSGILAKTAPFVRNKAKPYPIHAFGKFAPVLKLIAKAVQVDPEMPGSSLLGVTSALAQPLINVSDKASGQGCPVTVNVFVVAESAERKSSTIDAVIKPVYAAIRSATDMRRSMIIQDVTPDGMVVGLIARCHAQLLLALEGASLLGGHAMARDNQDRFLAIVSSLFSGEPLTRTRVEEHHYAEGRRLSVLLFCQPIIALDYLSSERIMQQGLGNRFVYSQPASMLGARIYNDIELETEPLYIQYCEKITALASQPWDINTETGGVDTRTVRMSIGAKAARVKFYNSLELAAGPGGDLATHAGYVTRFPEQVMRIAALLAILEDPKVQEIEEEIMLRAIELGNYYLDSALNMFDAAPANKDEMDAGTLLDWMQKKAAELRIAAIPVRMMYKDGPRCARPSKRTKELLSLLDSRGEVIEYTKTITYGNNNRSSENYAVVSI
jgi:hypothetical protein